MYPGTLVRREIKMKLKNSKHRLVLFCFVSSGKLGEKETKQLVSSKVEQYK